MTVYIYDDSVAVGSESEEILQDAAGIDNLITMLQARKAQMENGGY